MLINELISSNPKLAKLLTNMPETVKTQCLIKQYPSKAIIQRKDDFLKYFSIICIGEVNILNEFENGNQILIEKNEAIDFVGEVTALSDQEKTSVTIEAVTDCTIIQLPLKNFFQWLEEDSNFLLFISKRIANKLYNSSYTRGIELFYPAIHLMLGFLIRYGERNMNNKQFFKVDLTHQQISEFLGVTSRTINRVVKQLKDEEMISINKGKIQVNSIQYKRLIDAMNDKIYI